MNPKCPFCGEEFVTLIGCVHHILRCPARTPEEVNNDGVEELPEA